MRADEGLTLDTLRVGAVLVGGTIAFWLYGVTLAQIVQFSRRNHEDSKAMKYSIGVIWIMDTAHTVCVAFILYYFLVTMRGQITAPFRPQWVDGASMVMANMSDLFVRGILVFRIVILSNKNLWLCIPVAFVMVVSNGIGIYCSAIYSISSPVVVASTVTWPVLTCLSMSALADIAISAILCLLFRRMSRQTRMAYPLLQRLSRYVIGAGILPSMIALAALTAYAIFPGTFIYMGIYFTLSKSTLNSMLYMLNARQNLRAVAQKASLVQTGVSLGTTLQGSDVKMVETNRVRRRAATIVGGSL